jgi:hypothetical protein
MSAITWNGHSMTDTTPLPTDPAALPVSLPTSSVLLAAVAQEAALISITIAKRPKIARIFVTLVVSGLMMMAAVV